MSYNLSRVNTLNKLGIQQLPPILAESSDEAALPLIDNLPIRMMPVPGVRCPTCLARGQTVWVIKGKRCPQCGSDVN